MTSNSVSPNASSSDCNAKNRLDDGIVGFLTLAMPIWVPKPPPRGVGKE